MYTTLTVCEVTTRLIGHRGFTAETFKSATFWVECLQLSLSISRIKRQKESENDAKRERERERVCACVRVCVKESECVSEWEKYQKSVLRILKISWLWGPMLGLLCGSFCPRTLWICLCDAMTAHPQKTALNWHSRNYGRTIAQRTYPNRKFR